MKSPSDERNDIGMQSLSWRGNFAHYIGISLSAISTSRPCLPRFLPLLYLTICIPTVLFLVLFRQPLSNPDELSHVSRAYQISHGIVLTEEAVPGLTPKGMVDNALFLLGGQVKKRRYEALNTALPVFQGYGWTGNETLKRFNSSVYFPAAFIPQAVALKIAQRLNLPLVQSLQLSSMLNAATCLLIIAVAIHLAAEGKFLVAFIGALPMTLHQLSSSSPDGILIAGSLMMFSLVITALAKSKVSPLTLIGVVLFGALIAATKPPYLPLALAALAGLWRAEPRSGKDNLVYVFACIAMVCIPVLWMKFSNASAVNHNPEFQTDPGAQIAFLVSHPLQIPGLVFSTFYTFGKIYLVQMIGVLGWLDARLHPAALNLLGVGLIATLALDGLSVKPLLRWICLAAAAASVGLVLASLYLTWNPLFSLGPIQGVQGRYFLPILPFLAFLMPKLRSFDSDNLKLAIFTICGLVGGFATMAAIANRYYS